MRPIELKDIVPRTGSFRVPRGDGFRAFRLRPFSLLDEEWLRQTFGDRSEEVLQKGTVAEFARIAYHQLVPEDQAEFVTQIVHIVDAKGTKVDMELGGENLLMAQITGMGTKKEVAIAVWETIGVSRPAIDAMRESAGLKKKEPSESTGARSSTRSQPSTGGRQGRSSPSRHAR